MLSFSCFELKVLELDLKSLITLKYWWHDMMREMRWGSLSEKMIEVQKHEYIYGRTKNIKDLKNHQKTVRKQPKMKTLRWCCYGLAHPVVREGRIIGFGTIRNGFTFLNNVHNS